MNSQIELSLNQTEENSIKMKDIILRLHEIAVNEKRDVKELVKIQKEFNFVARQILKEEWEKAKRLE